LFQEKVNTPRSHLVIVSKAMDSRILPFLRALVAYIFKMSPDLDVARNLGYAPF